MSEEVLIPTVFTRHKRQLRAVLDDPDDTARGAEALERVGDEVVADPGGQDGGDVVEGRGGPLGDGSEDEVVELGPAAGLVGGGGGEGEHQRGPSWV